MQVRFSAFFQAKLAFHKLLSSQCGHPDCSVDHFRAEFQAKRVADVTSRNRPTSHTKLLNVVILREMLRTNVIDPTNGTDFRVFDFGGDSGQKSNAKF